MTENRSNDPGIDRSKRIVFDQVAADYDAARPRYPEKLIDEMIKLSGIPKGGRILEVGCGPGIITLPLARREYRMTCIELGLELATLARKNCEAYPGVEIITGTFEDWPLERNAFDLFVSAEAFHWIPPEIGYPKAAAALKEGGSAALAWILNRSSNSEVERAIDQVYSRWSDRLSAPERELTPEWLIPIITENFSRSKSFGPVTVQRFAWAKAYSSDRYVQLLRTRSANELEPEEKEKFLNEIAATIDACGGQLKTLLQAVLFLAQVRK